MATLPIWFGIIEAWRSRKARPGGHNRARQIVMGGPVVMVVLIKRARVSLLRRLEGPRAAIATSEIWRILAMRSRLER